MYQKRYMTSVILITQKTNNLMQKFEVMYFPLPGCSGSLHKIVVESTDLYTAGEIVMAMFNIPRSNILATDFYHG